jgi:protein TonB
MFRHLAPWLVPLACSSLLHTALVWAALDVSLTSAPRPPVLFPVYLAAVQEPPPPVTPAERPKPPARRPVALRVPVPPVTAPPRAPEPVRPVESTANVQPPAVTIEERGPTASDQKQNEPRDPAPTRADTTLAVAAPSAIPAPPAADALPLPSGRSDASARDPHPAASPDSASPAPSVASIQKGAVESTLTARPRGGYQVMPAYPATARRLGIEGTTVLRVHVAEDGRVGEIQVQKSAGHPDLDRAAADAIRRWRFDPARRGNDAVAVWVLLPVEFHLAP